MKLLLFLLIMIPINMIGQNLVKNPSFDNVNLPQCYTIPIGTANTFYILDEWSFANYGAINNNADCFHYCFDSLPWLSHIPYLGPNFQYPHTGSGFTGLYAFDYEKKPPLDSIIEYSEYLQGQLFSSLISGRNYIFSCYISLNDVCNYTFSDLSVYLSSILINESSLLLSNYSPQINNISYITVKNGWEKITIPFIASGGEQFFVIGNFTNYSLMDTIYIGGGNSDYGNKGYFYIDDVSIYPADAPVYSADAGGDQLLCEGESLVLGSPSRSQYLYWWYDAEGNLIDTTAQITVSPEISTYYVLHQKDFKFDESYDTAFVYVSDCADPLYIPNIFSPNGDGNNDVFWVRGEGISEIKNFIIYNRWGEEVHNCKCNEIGHGSNCCGWNGNFRGENAPVGVYAYYVEAVLLNGETVIKRGNVTLVR
ncbi:MAG: gliding motility-associated C-terminal domain-containing protein [Bacteroidales bacterium]|nr:gliding motility-associated C-terminal domain-containing protein [Bacteroidales bacterium]